MADDREKILQASANRVKAAIAKNKARREHRAALSKKIRAATAKLVREKAGRG